MQTKQYSEEELFGINLEENYECFTFTHEDGSTIYLYDRIRETH